MQNLNYVLEVAGISIVLTYLVVCTIRLKQLSNEIESMRMEQEKLNFRLFIAEKMQKISQENKFS